MFWSDIDVGVDVVAFCCASVGAVNLSAALSFNGGFRVSAVLLLMALTVGWEQSDMSIILA